ncbi:hypothetical protein HL670_00053 [Serratia plymuthica]|nr:hypothetical protein HL670_00053 [Serratia plymuthica]
MAGRWEEACLEPVTVLNEFNEKALIFSMGEPINHLFKMNNKAVSRLVDAFLL